MIVDPETFVGDVVSELTRSAPVSFTSEVVFNKRLQDSLLALRAAAVEGLRNRDPNLHANLKARKTDVIAAVANNHFTVEKLLQTAIDRVMAEARKP